MEQNEKKKNSDLCESNIDEDDLSENKKNKYDLFYDQLIIFLNRSTVK